MNETCFSGDQLHQHGTNYFQQRYVFLFKKKNLFIYLFILTFGCALAFSSCGKRGLLFVAVHGLLIVVASLVAEHGL